MIKLMIWQIHKSLLYLKVPEFCLVFLMAFGAICQRRFRTLRVKVDV